MEFGRNAQQLQAMHDAGKKVPAVENRPSLTGWGWLWEAFWALHTCRGVGTAAGSIPWTAVQHYAEAAHMNEEETTMLHQVIRHMDARLLEHYRAQSQSPAPRKKASRGFASR